MAPQKAPKKRGAPIPATTFETFTAAQMKQLLSDTLAATMPDLLAQVKEDIIRSIRDSTGRDTGIQIGGPGAGGPEIVGGSGLVGGTGSRSEPIIIQDPPSGCSYKSVMDCSPVQSPPAVQSYAVVAIGGQGGRPRCGRCTGTHAPGRACWICARCRRKGHTERFCKFTPGTCYECGDPNHHRNKCPKWKSPSGNSVVGSPPGKASRFCVRCKREGHTEPYCKRALSICYEHGESSHRLDTSPMLMPSSGFSGNSSGSNPSGGNPRARVFSMEATKAEQDPRDATGTFLTY